MWKASWSIAAAVLVALLAMSATYLLVVVLGGVNVSDKKQAATVTDVMQAAIAALSPVAAMIAAVFLYRRSKVNLADSRRSDDAAYQERFVEASTLLGNDNPAVRVAGVIAMAALARDWDPQRQRCVDVLCGYMRVPVTGREKRGDNGESTEPRRFEIADHGENEVRNSLVRALVRVLSDPYVRRGESISVDLHGAAFGDDADFRDVTFTGNADFSGANFTGSADFSGATIRGDANFSKATFGFATFCNARFVGIANFQGGAFNEAATFAGAIFKVRGYFGGATFASISGFLGVEFMGGADLWRATFKGDASLVGATFTRSASFRDVGFASEATFRGATFASDVTFWGATFTKVILDSFGSEATVRGPLGPLSTESNVPDPPGLILDERGEIVGCVEWVVAQAGDK